MNFTKTIVNAMMTWVNKKIKENASDWNQNDPNADGYIKNRPFYSEKTGGIIIDTVVNIEGNYVKIGRNVRLEAGKTYTVILNGITYKCVARKYNDAILLGNGQIYGDGYIGNNEPFCFDNYPNEGGEIYLNAAENGKYTVCINDIIEVIKKIDSKYVPIPDGIITENDLSYVAFSGNYYDLIDAPYDAVRYEEQSLTTTQQAQARANIGAGTSNFSGSYNDLTDKPMSQDTIALVDQVNGYTYIIQMQNGSLVSSCAVSSIKVAVLPDKLAYTAGEYFDSTGMVVMGICADGSAREISNVIIPDGYLTVDTTSVEISYVEAGITYTASVPVTVTSFDLVDFDYTANANGTYTLTGWKGTLNGATSTEMIIPNNGLIVV